VYLTPPHQNFVTLIGQKHYNDGPTNNYDIWQKYTVTNFNPNILLLTICCVLHNRVKNNVNNFHRISMNPTKAQ